MLFIWNKTSRVILYTVDDPVPKGAVERYREKGLGVSEVPRIVGLGAIPTSELYVDEDGQIQPRNVMALDIEGRGTWRADGESTLTIRGIPSGTSAAVDGEQVGSVDDGFIELTTMQAHMHRVELRHPRYVTVTIEEAAT